MPMSIAKFYKVSKSQFNEDLNSLLNINDDSVYDNVAVPVRATKGSAGYDFVTPVSFTLKPGETVKIPTGIRCYIDSEYVLQIYPRSSLGFKYQLNLLNTVGIIDSDYFNAKNEGHIIVGLVNRGTKDIEVKAGDRFVQGIFCKYYLAEEEENTNERTGGFGSTN